jgi:hypothetical protein
VDLVATLRRQVPEEIELRQLCGQIVWLREGAHEWTGPVDQALALLETVSPAGGFWSVFAPVEAA